MPSNFLQWNPSGTNQENDTQYGADPQRSGGATTGAIFTSLTANKLFFQVTTFIAAFANSLSAKGYNLNDANLTTLQGVLNNVLTAADGGSTPVIDHISAAGTVRNNAGVNFAHVVELLGGPGGYTRTLPLASGGVGSMVTFKIAYTSGLAVTFVPNPGSGNFAELGQVTSISPPYHWITYLSDGSLWWTVGQG